MTDRLVAGRYRVDGNGSTRHAIDVGSELGVVLRPVPSGDANRMGAASTTLRHANLVPVVGVVEDGQPWQVSEEVHGELLEDLVARSGRLPAARAVRIAREILAGLAHAHDRGIAHGGLTPESVVVASDDTAMVAGFGTVPSSPRVAAMWEAPEALHGPASRRADIYAVGCILHAMLRGSPPYVGGDAGSIRSLHATGPVPSLRTDRADVTHGLERVVERAMAKDPAMRFSSARDMDAALAATGLDLTHDATPVMRPATVVVSGHSHGAAHEHVTSVRPAWWAEPGVWVIAALLGVLIVLVAVFAATSSDDPAASPTPIVVTPVPTAVAPPVVQQPAVPAPQVIVVPQDADPAPAAPPAATPQPTAFAVTPSP